MEPTVTESAASQSPTQSPTSPTSPTETTKQESLARLRELIDLIETTPAENTAEILRLSALAGWQFKRINNL